MRLSARAERYLATLRRGNPVPLSRVREALRRAQCPAFDSSLDFHSRYAGYEEVLGNDTAVWGLVHIDPSWLDPGEVCVERDDTHWRAACADEHPSFDDWLDFDGEFSSSGGGGRCESFDVKVERNALLHETSAGSRSWQLDFDLVEASGSVHAFCEQVGAEVIPEASDKYATSWKSRDVLVIESQSRATVWVASDAQNLVKGAPVYGVGGVVRIALMRHFALFRE